MKFWKIQDSITKKKEKEANNLAIKIAAAIYSEISYSENPKIKMKTKNLNNLFLILKKEALNSISNNITKKELREVLLKEAEERYHWDKNIDINSREDKERIDKIIRKKGIEYYQKHKNSKNMNLFSSLTRKIRIYIENNVENDTENDKKVQRQDLIKTIDQRIEKEEKKEESN